MSAMEDIYASTLKELEVAILIISMKLLIYKLFENIDITREESTGHELEICQQLLAIKRGLA